MSQPTAAKPPSPRKGSSLPARLWGSCLGLAVAGSGVVLCLYLWGAYQKARETDDWVRTPCTILASAVVEGAVDQHGLPLYQLEIRYRYEFEGESHLSDRAKYLPSSAVQSSSKDKIEGWVEDYPPGFETTCLVNPDHPDTAILKPNTKAALYTMWFPLLFVFGGLGIVAASWRRRK